MKHPKANLWILIIALFLPTAITYPYFVIFNDASPQITQTLYSIGKTLQFSLPLIWFYWACGKKMQWIKPAWDKSMLYNILFGCAAVACGFLIFSWMQKDAALITLLETNIMGKIATFGLDSFFAYVLFGFFVTMIHSLLEEYYWRWFVFRGLKEIMSIRSAAVISSIGFVLHHIIILAAYFGLFSFYTALFSLFIFVGGFVWALTYTDDRKLYNIWFSHAVIDAGIFLIGFMIIGSQLA